VSSNLTASAISGTRRYVFSKLVKNSGKPLLKCAQSIKSDLGSGHLKYDIQDLIKSVILCAVVGDGRDGSVLSRQPRGKLATASLYL
jgi:hypothetical protein